MHQHVPSLRQLFLGSPLELTIEIMALICNMPIKRSRF